MRLLKPFTAPAYDAWLPHGFWLFSTVSQQLDKPKSDLPVSSGSSMTPKGSHVQRRRRRRRINTPTASPTGVIDFHQHDAPKKQSTTSARALGLKSKTNKAVAAQPNNRAVVYSSDRLGFVLYNPLAAVNLPCKFAVASNSELECFLSQARKSSSPEIAGDEDRAGERTWAADERKEIAGEEDRASERSLEREARATEVISDDEATEGEYDEEEDDLDAVVESNEGDVRALCEKGFADHRPSAQHVWYAGR